MCYSIKTQIFSQTKRDLSSVVVGSLRRPSRTAHGRVAGTARHPALSAARSTAYSARLLAAQSIRYVIHLAASVIAALDLSKK